MSKRTRGLEPLSHEMAGADLGDARLSKRLGQLSDDLAEMPGESFPKALRESAPLEAAYRFFSNPNVTLNRILDPHFAGTAARCDPFEQVLVVHDTTEFEFDGEVEREGLGRLLASGQGFFGHFSLAVSADGRREPLGLLGLSTVFRRGTPVPKKHRAKQPRGEAQRWRAGADDAEARLRGRTRAIHVMDREGDAYPLLAGLATSGHDFVIRGAHDRLLNGPIRKLREAAQHAPTVIEREVQLSRRGKASGTKKAKIYPARSARTTRLSLAATRVVLAPRITAGSP